MGNVANSVLLRPPGTCNALNWAAVHLQIERFNAWLRLSSHHVALKSKGESVLRRIDAKFMSCDRRAASKDTSDARGAGTLPAKEGTEDSLRRASVRGRESSGGTRHGQRSAVAAVDGVQTQWNGPWPTLIGRNALIN